MFGGSMKRWFAIVMLWPSLALADTFTVTDIRIQGLQRVSAGTVFNLLPVNVGDQVDEATVRQLIRLLFQSGYFRDVRLQRDGNALIVTVVERPAIDSIELKGNKSIKTDALMEGLGKQGLKEGEIFKQSTLERVDLELERQYVSQGRYGASIDTNVEELPRNRVAIHIVIKEGKTSTIQHINVVGNNAFSEADLLDVFELKTPSFFSFIKNDDKYSKEKLKGDLEKKAESWAGCWDRGWGARGGREGGGGGVVGEGVGGGWRSGGGWAGVGEREGGGGGGVGGWVGSHLVLREGVYVRGMWGGRGGVLLEGWCGGYHLSVCRSFGRMSSSFL
jgi:outer membrane protein assembly factor BamA